MKPSPEAARVLRYLFDQIEGQCLAQKIVGIWRDPRGKQGSVPVAIVDEIEELLTDPEHPSEPGVVARLMRFPCETAGCVNLTLELRVED